MAGILCLGQDVSGNDISSEFFLLRGTSITRYFPVYANPDPLADCAVDRGFRLPTTYNCTAAITSTSVTGLSITATAVVDPTLPGKWSVRIDASAAMNAPESVSVAVSPSITVTSTNYPSIALGGSEGIIAATVYVQPVFQDVGFFYPGIVHPEDLVRATSGDPVDLSISRTPDAAYKVFIAGRLSQAAVDLPTAYSFLPGLIKLGTTAGEMTFPAVNETVLSYPADWFATYGDPFTSGATAAHLKLFANQSGANYYPLELPNLQFPPSSAVGIYPISTVRADLQYKFVPSEVGAWRSAAETLAVQPYVRSEMFWYDSGDASYKATNYAVEVLAFPAAETEVTLYPATALDSNPAHSTEPLTLGVEISFDGGTSWSALSDTDSRYRYELLDTSEAGVPPIDVVYDNGSGEATYAAAVLRFYARTAGTYRLRVRPTADANPAVASDSVVTVTAVAVPSCSLTYGAIPSPAPNTAFDISLSAFAPSDVTSYKIVLNGLDTTGSVEDLELYRVSTGALVGKLSAPGETTGLTAGTTAFSIHVPALASGKSTTQSFTGIIQLVATVGTVTYTITAGTLTYSRSGAPIVITGPTALNCSPYCSPTEEATVTYSVAWVGLGAGAVISLVPALPAGSTGTLTCSPSSIDTGVLSSPRNVVVTFTQPNPAISSAISGCTLTATSTTNVATKTFQVNPCGTGTGNPVLSYYGAADAGIIFAAAAPFNSLSTLVYTNTCPASLTAHTTNNSTTLVEGYFKVRLGGLPDTTGIWNVEFADNPNFTGATVVGTPASQDPGEALSGTIGIPNSFLALVGRYGDVAGDYVANDIVVSIRRVGFDPLSSAPVYVRVVSPTNPSVRSNTLTLRSLPVPAVGAVYTGDTLASRTLYLEAGAGMLLTLNALATVSGTSYFGSSSPDPALFSIDASAGIFVAGGSTIFAKDTSLSGTAQHYWWETVGATTGSGTIYIKHGASTIATVPCVVIEKSTGVDLKIDGGTIGTITSGETKTLTYRLDGLMASTYKVVKSTGAYPIIGSSFPFVKADAPENASALYGVLSYGGPDPVPPLGTDAVSFTVVAVKAAVAGTACTGQPSAETPVNLVPAFVGTCYPPYIPELSGLRLPKSIKYSGSTTAVAVTDWNFGPVTITAGGSGVLNTSDPKKIGDSTVGLQFEIVADGAYFKLRTKDNGNLTTNKTTPLTISMDLNATTGLGCVRFPKTLTVSTETCSGPVEVVALDTLGYSAYSCDLYPRPLDPMPVEEGYDTTLTSPSIVSFIEDGLGTPSSAVLSNRLVNYGLGIVGTKFATGALASYIPVLSYTGIIPAGTASGSYPIYVTITGNSPTCTKKVYRLNYEKGAANSTVLATPVSFTVGTYVNVSYAEIFAADQLKVNMNPGVLAELEDRIAPDYSLQFVPADDNLTTVTTSVSYDSGTKTVSYSVPSTGVLAQNAIYKVYLVHKSTGCTYADFSGFNSAYLGAVTYKGVRSATNVTFTGVSNIAPCFTTIPVSGTGNGLGKAASYSVFADTTSPSPLTGWGNLSVRAKTVTSVQFDLPYAETAFPTGRAAPQNRTVYVQLYDATGVALLPDLGILPLSLKAPSFVITSEGNLSPTIGALTHDFSHSFTVVPTGSTACSSCSGGCVADTLADTLAGATTTWTGSTLGPWMAADPSVISPNYKIWNSTTVPSTPYNVVIEAKVTYYGQIWTVTKQDPLVPSSSFVVDTPVLNSVEHGTPDYTAYIHARRPPVGCGTLDWSILTPNPTFPAGVSIGNDPGDSESAILLWSPTVDDPSRTLYPVTYTFTVQALCPSTGASAVSENITLTVTPSRPTLNSIIPSLGYFDRVNEEVTIYGDGFATGAVVLFGNEYATDVVVNGSFTEITCIPPVVADVGGDDVTVQVVVRNIDNGSSDSNLHYTYTRQRSPILLSIAPSSGTPLGGTKVLLTGANFEPSSVVTIDGIEQPLLAVTPSSILFVTYPHSVGDVDVVVSNSNCGGAQGACPSIQYTFRVSPQIMNITPFNVSATGENPFYVTGTGFYVNGEVKPRVLVDNFEIPAALITYKVV